jgi:hypothetical protein
MYHISFAEFVTKHAMRDIERGEEGKEHFLEEESKKLYLIPLR